MKSLILGTALAWTETFPLYQQYPGWVDSDAAHNFHMDAGNLHTDFESEYGLFTAFPNGEHAKSYAFPGQYTLPIVIQVDIRHEKRQTCGEVSMRLYHDLDKESLDSNTPFLVSLGPQYCDKMSSIQVQVADSKGQVHNLEKHIFAPVDNRWHTY